MHPTLGILRKSQAVFYASAFFQSDGVPPPAPARVTQTVRRSHPKRGTMEIHEYVLRIYYIAVMVSALLYLFESFGMMFSSFFLFRFGFIVKTTYGVNINIENFEIGKGYTTTHAKFTRVSKNSCLFCHRFGFFRINTPVPIKGEILRNENGTLLIWRIPFSSIMFFVLFLLGWFIPPLMWMFPLNVSEIFSSNFATNCLATLVGIVFMWGLIASSSQLEQKRIRLALSELLLSSLHQ